MPHVDAMIDVDNDKKVDIDVMFDIILADVEVT